MVFEQRDQDKTHVNHSTYTRMDKSKNMPAIAGIFLESILSYL